MTHVRKVGMLIALSLIGCDTAETGWTTVEQQTASGVQRMVNEPPPTGIEPTWTIVPEVRIGAVEGDGPENFGTIKGIAVDDQGRIAVLDAQAQEIRIFGADGKYQRTFGGKGGGPGEFTDANGLLLGNDGLLRVNDPGNARLSFFHPDTGFAGSIPLNVSSFGWIWTAVLDSADNIFERAYMIIGGEGREAIKGYDRQGRWTDTIPQAPPRAEDQTRGVYTWSRGTSNTMTTVPFWPSAVSAMDPRRAFWTKFGEGNDYAIARTTFTGDTTLIFESRRQASPVTQSERDSAIKSLRERAGKDLDWSQIPETKPIVTQLFVADEGDVWVRVTTSEPVTTFDVFASDGKYKGTAILDGRALRFLSPIVRGDRFYAVVMDELDVQYVMRGRIAQRE